MKILALLGTPRKRNTLEMIKKIEGLMTKNGIQNLEFKYIFVDELDLGFYRGCYSCYKKGEHTCPKHDKLKDVLDELEECHGIIFGTPVYGDSFSALSKTFIDYLSYLFHRPALFDKKAIVLATTNESGLKPAIEYIRQSLARWGCEIVDTIGIKIMRYQTRPKYKDMTDELFVEIAKKLELAINEDWISTPQLDEVIQFRVMQTWTNVIGKDVSPTDYKYWEEKGWLDSKYYIPIRIKPMHNIIANAISKRVRKAILKPV